MSTWVPPRPIYHLRVFAVSLVLVFVSLCGFLFGVRMEAVAPASGILLARDLEELRAPAPGLVEPGWYQGELSAAGGKNISVRLDIQGNGLAEVAAGVFAPVQHYQLSDGSVRFRREDLRFHPLAAGDELWPGQLLAVVRGPAAASERSPVDTSSPPTAAANEWVIRAGEEQPRWQVVEAACRRQQAVAAGEVLARVVPLDPETRQPRQFLARLELNEKHCGGLAEGQTVRLFSAMHNPRLHGHAEAVLERLEPWGEPSPTGERRFHAVARVLHSPFRLALGSSVKAEVLLGKRQVYRIILEQ